MTNTIILCGPPGSGKSNFAEQIAAHYGCGTIRRERVSPALGHLPTWAALNITDATADEIGTYLGHQLAPELRSQIKVVHIDDALEELYPGDSEAKSRPGAPLVPELGTDSPQHLLDVYPTLAQDLAADDRFVAAFDEARGELSFSDTLKMAKVEKLEAETALINLKIAERRPQSLGAAFFAVRLFHQTFGHPAPNAPVLLNAARRDARIEWIKEELGELSEAQSITEQADALIDAIYFCLGGLVEMGVDPSPIFDLVQAANMAKVWDDGSPRFREDGKIIKPDGWVAPDAAIEIEVQRQIDMGGVA